MSALFVDGRPAQAIAADDRALHYGDGVFTTLAATSERVLLWSRHRARLDWACARLALPRPDWPTLLEEIRTLAGPHRGPSVIKVILSRAPGQRGYRPGDGPCRRIVLRYDWPVLPPERWTRGVRVRLCRWRLAAQPRLAGIKHLNRLEQVMARAEWTDEVEEGLLSDRQGRVIGGTMSNLMVIDRGRLLTPRIEDCGIAGVMRGLVMDIAAAWGMPCQATTITPAMLDGADELFLSNALIGLWPVCELEGRERSPGPVCRRLQDALRERGAILDVAGGTGRDV